MKRMTPGQIFEIQSEIEKQYPRGSIWQNIKHETMYIIRGVSMHTETHETMIEYTSYGSMGPGRIHFTRPLENFRERFRFILKEAL